ncbi:hypothetical protein DOY81_001613 [Sarcophaga bullata]|nr:hypothetical protein DOY81_001613 [Sarcophaga bullata]
MESSSLSPSSISNGHNNAEGWKSLKRASERFSETDEPSLGSDGEDFILENRHSKRLKSLGNSYLEEEYFESPVILRPKRNFPNKVRFQEVNQSILSPITEISMNLNETSLCGGNSLQDSSCTAPDGGYDEGTTPVGRKRSLLKANVFKRSHRYKEDAKVISTKDQCWSGDANGDVIDNDKLGDEKESLNNLDPSTTIITLTVHTLTARQLSLPQNVD